MDVYLFWWALERVLQGRLDEPDFGPGRELTEGRFERRSMPTLRQLFVHARETGLCGIYACTGSRAAVDDGISSGGEELIDAWVGWSTILQRTAGVTDRFYL